MLNLELAPRHALQRQNAENLKQIFPEKEYRGLSPNFHIICFHDGSAFSAGGNMWTDPGNYINRSQTYECGNWSWGRAIPRKGIYKRNCRCSVDLNGTLVCAHLICVPLRPTSVLMPNLALVETKNIKGKLYFLKMENFLWKNDTIGRPFNGWNWWKLG